MGNHFCTTWRNEMLITELHHAAQMHLPRLPLRDLILLVRLETTSDGHLQPHVIANLRLMLINAHRKAPSDDARMQLRNMLDAMPR